jgi:hypothetical protein
MQDLVAEYQQYQDATCVFILLLLLHANMFLHSVEEEGEYEEPVPENEE